MKISIYRILFEDGTSYVGQSRDVRNRVYQHKGSPCNKRLGEKLRGGVSYEVIIISTHRKQSCADVAEGRAIRSTDPMRILNWRPAPGPRRRGKKGFAERTTGSALCSWCQERKHGSCFYADRNRSCGVGSRCKQCLRKYYSAREAARKNGASASEAYYAAKKLVIQAAAGAA